MQLALALLSAPPPATPDADAANAAADSGDGGFAALLAGASGEPVDDQTADAPQAEAKSATVTAPSNPTTPLPAASFIVQLALQQPPEHAIAATGQNLEALPAPTPNGPSELDASLAAPETPGATNLDGANANASPASTQTASDALGAKTAPHPPRSPTLEAPPTPPVAPDTEANTESENAPPSAANQVAPLARAVSEPPKGRQVVDTTKTDASEEPDASVDVHETTDTSAEPEPVRHVEPKSSLEYKAAQSDSATLAPNRVAPDTGAPAQPAPTTTTAISDSTIALDLSVRGDSHKQTHTQSSAHAGAQVAQEIIRKFNGDSTTFDLRLDPPELGRVEVRLELSRDNRVSAIVSADNPQALAELARNARDLQSALQSAGLDLADNGLSFDLRQQGRQSGEPGNGRPTQTFGDSDSSANTATIVRLNPLDPWRGRAIDVMA
jgi:hypothetical protein